MLLHTQVCLPETMPEFLLLPCDVCPMLPCNTVLSLLATSHMLCVEFARLQD